MCTYVHQKTQTYKVHRQNESNPIYIKNRIGNVWYVYIMEYYNAVKKKELMLNATTWMNLTDIVSHKSQTQMFMYCVISLNRVQKEVRGIKGVEVKAVVTFGRG